MVQNRTHSIKELPRKYHPIIGSQGAIGLGQIFNRKILRLWIEHQGDKKGRVHMEYILGAPIMEMCL